MASSDGSLDLPKLFPGNDVCLLRDEEDVKTWRIRNVQAKYLNQLRNWFETELESVAIAWVNVSENGGVLNDELLVHRLGLIPIAADPLSLEPVINSEDYNEYNDKKTIAFEINVKNDKKTFLRVFSGSLVWKPIGDQSRNLGYTPAVDDETILVTVLEPGQSLKLTAYATRGTKRMHAKWASANLYFKGGARASPGRSSPIALEATVDDSDAVKGAGAASGAEKCLPCDKLSVDFSCFHFTVERIGGLTFSQIQDQLDSNFKWPNGAPPPPTRKVVASSASTPAAKSSKVSK